MTNRQDSPTESVVDVEFYSYMWNHKPNNETMVLKSVFVEVSFTLHGHGKKASFCKCILLNVNVMGVSNL